VSEPEHSTLNLSGFACAFGELPRPPESIAQHEEICAAHGVSLELSTMGCKTFWQMTRKLESYVVASIAETLARSNVAADQVDAVLFASSDQNLPALHVDFTRNVLAELGLVRCIPTLISFQQCASSLAALAHARGLLADPSVSHVLLVAFDFVRLDCDRIKPFALFGDAVASCLVSRDRGIGLTLRSCGSAMDMKGLRGSDDFGSRRSVAARVLQEALSKANVKLPEIERVFSTNIYKPIAMFSTSMLGIRREQLYIETLAERAHCGNCDWMINLSHALQQGLISPARKYVIHASAPGFHAAGVLQATDAI
jgi:3-oxoacyl-[acyl-carrier-protein] synthase III